MELEVRCAIMNDAERLWKWKNDPDTRRFAIQSQDIIPFRDHQEWLWNTLNNGKTDLFILSCDRVACGDIRFDKHFDHTEVSIRIDPRFRGRGIAQWAIWNMDKGYKNRTARIVNGNVASMRAFVKSGYVPTDYITHYTKPIGYYVLKA